MTRSPELQRFYGSRQWHEFRNYLVIARGGRCERCGKDFSTEKYQLVAHHKEHLTDDNLRDPNIAYNPDNIEILCRNCHAFYHHDNGFIKRHKQVFIVYGAPMSGKTSHVRENMDAGDLVVDLDAIRAAVSFEPLYHTPAPLNRIVFGVRDFLYDQIRTRNGDWNTAWVISGLPRKDERERLAARLGASLVLIEATKQECLDRLYASDDGRSMEWAEYIEKWFREYIP